MGSENMSQNAKAIVVRENPASSQKSSPVASAAVIAAANPTTTLAMTLNRNFRRVARSRMLFHIMSGRAIRYLHI
jgi:hypothetical protein